MAGDDAKQRLFEDVVAANQRRIMAISRSYARADDYRDLCQEILLQMWKGLDGFEGRSAPSTWVYRVALNTAITFRRENGRRDCVFGLRVAKGEIAFPGDPPRA